MFAEIRKHNVRERLFDVGLAGVVIAVVVMMVVPLTPWILDLLITLNLGISVLILTMALFLTRPLRFAAFPTLLLIATLYRLALNVSSTRLILLRADAGEIIGGFGGYVVGGDILVGAVIFGILAMVLFLVITKGAERVAEVAARFTLDGLPGMQLAIDSDLRSGAISALEASHQRRALDRQSRYYGSLDGAMKFVRGDAIAGLVIIGVNIAGGLAVGTLRHGMSLGQALDSYGRLTVGDGLVTMIPALLISTAAGLLVTRVGQGGQSGRLGSQIGEQLSSEPRALGAAAALMLVMAAIPEFPAWPFLLVGVLLALFAVRQLRREYKAKETRDETAEAFFEPNAKEARAVLEVEDGLYDVLIAEAGDRGGLQRIARQLGGSLRDDLGLPIATVPIVRMANGHHRREVRLKIRNLVVRKMVLSSPDSAANAGDALHPIVQMAASALRERAWQLVDIDMTQALVDQIQKNRPVLVRETVPKVVGLADLSRLLARLVADGIRLDCAGEVLEVLSRTTAGADSEELYRQVRSGLAPLITARLLDGDTSFSAVVLDADMESVLMGSLTTSARGRKLALSSSIQNEVTAACRKAFEKSERRVLLVNSALRAPLATMLNGSFRDVQVIAHDEIEPHVSVDVVGRVGI